MARILIIDDDTIIRNILCKILQYEGFYVEEAEDGKKGLDLIKSVEYDLVLCDIQMPVLNGIEVLEKVKKLQLPTHPLMIMTSGKSDVETVVKAIKNGAFDFISKPLDINRFLITVNNAMKYVELNSETKLLKNKINKVNEMIDQAIPISKIKEMLRLELN